MVATTTKILALAAVAALASTSMAYDGAIWLYEDKDFGGQEEYIPLNVGVCTHVPTRIDNKASSAKWNAFGNEKYVQFYFFDGDACTGRMRLWMYDYSTWPHNFREDGINDAISSVVVYTGRVPKPWNG